MKYAVVVAATALTGFLSFAAVELVTFKNYQANVEKAWLSANFQNLSQSDYKRFLTNEKENKSISEPHIAGSGKADKLQIENTPYIEKLNGGT